MISQQIAKPSFTKSKAFGLCGTLALATALLIGAGTVSADETVSPVADTQPAVSNVYTADNAGNVTVTPSEPVAETPVFTPPAPVESQPIAETPATTTEVAQPVAETPAAPTTVTKTGDTINVENPNVEVTFPNGNGKYSPFEVEYKDIQIPDDVPVNEGDKVTFDLPEEVKFQTSYEFDVHNPEKAVVGKATADATTNKVTAVFNDYFKSHPLNKIMNLKLDASWTDKVVSGKPVNVNFNGTVVTANIGSEQVIGKDELIAKWGFQDKEDPTVINWTARVNYAKKVLNYVTIIDEMSENQKLVDNYFEIKNIESVDPWVDKGSAMDLVKSISKSEHGFEIKMDRLDHMVYLYYKTKLVNAVKDSTNPTNKIELKAESDGAVSYTKIQLVGGRGDASGENKPEPTFEIPHDAPKVEIPEWNGGVTPPNAPKYDKPEFNGGVVPNEAPIYDKPELNINDVPLLPPAPVVDIPEWKGGTVPFDAPVLDKPEWNGGVVPNEAPILDLPELEIPVEPEKPATPTQNKPQNSTPAERSNGKAAQSVAVSYNLAPASKEVPKTAVYGGTLPSTGEKEGIASTLGLVVIAAGITALTLGFKKRNEGEEE
ncbi:SIALI-17 repeat-containing surface protein [Streptococcus salivarius]|uniref:LPXTG cell wall anchor domain-containing protein n=1 Tax=Streptococcus salivarius TaxID=1304 RepID=A0A6A8UBF1_STRSL|nr:SIALI-17 repeat-containing surface protein [Streptococcus salivarius]MTQ89450.1 LPXTG cell wall anchor domain-containing protein [Streptococcus salivarius]MTR27027.1 LPXTG cell wall anchor domain-containing protein [Streptococcus salivarius]MTR38278.1 LPXTG cell wall anchor domain-containing protein [Streptococcus salivarius]